MHESIENLSDQEIQIVKLILNSGIVHFNTTNIPFNYQEITNFIGSRIFGVGKYFHSKSTRP
ncbi:hypothetical protein [Pediococcus pentosaceus]|uniref:hypothetical protein n=1 Tax=Pediococcus pentosaceus TaxID=1255 RepID=UPI002F265CC7